MKLLSDEFLLKSPPACNEFLIQATIRYAGCPLHSDPTGACKADVRILVIVRCSKMATSKPGRAGQLFYQRETICRGTAGPAPDAVVDRKRRNTISDSLMERLETQDSDTSDVALSARSAP